MLRKILSRTPIWPLLSRCRRLPNTIRSFGSTPFELELKDRTVLFSTSNPYSYGWFYPRYRDGRSHEPEVTSKFMKLASSADCIFDVGCNLGWFSCIAAKVNENASVYGFELEDSNCVLVRENKELNKADNLTIIQAAVANENGAATFNNPGKQPSASHRISEGSDGATAKTVDKITLDSFCSKIGIIPSLVKIDVEGAEQMVLEGMTQVLNDSNLQNLFIELHPQWLKNYGGSVEETLNILDSAGFQFAISNHRQSGAQWLQKSSIELQRSLNGDEMIHAFRNRQQID